jgi:hypothetical protein
MPIFTGPGKYDDVATIVRDMTRAEAVIVIIAGGMRGDGLSVQAPIDFTMKLPLMLRDVADGIEKVFKGEQSNGHEKKSGENRERSPE